MKPEEKINQAHRIVDFTKPLEEQDDIKKEAMSFPAECHVCYNQGETRMCIITVPFFKELVIMAFTC